MNNYKEEDSDKSKGVVVVVPMEEEDRSLVSTMTSFVGCWITVLLADVVP